MLGVVILVLIIRNGLYITNYFLKLNETMGSTYKFIKKMVGQYRISCMAIGGIAAYLVVYGKNKILAILYRKDVQWITYIGTILLLEFKIGIKSFAGENFPSFSYEAYSVLFAIIILNLSTNPDSIINLKYKWMSYLGKVSYGLYLFHPIMRVFSLQFTEYLFNRRIAGLAMDLCLYFFTIGSTILIAILSYEFFEKRMMRLKKKFV